MELNLIVSGAVFIILFLFFLINNYRKLRKSNYDKLWFFGYFITKFKLDKTKINYKLMNFEISIINALILAFVSFLVMLLPVNKIWLYLIEFVLLFAIIYSVYEIYGRYLIKRGWQKKNV